jgi:hypothetical protein
MVCRVYFYLLDSGHGTQGLDQVLQNLSVAWGMRHGAWEHRDMEVWGCRDMRPYRHRGMWTFDQMNYKRMWQQFISIMIKLLQLNSGSLSKKKLINKH